jgi:hypothetical protein
MIDFERESIVLPKDVCRMFPGRTGKGLALSTIWRWMLKGQRGQRLESLVVGGQRYTSKEAVRRFVAALNGGRNGHRSQQRTDRTHELKRVERELEAEGL